MRFQLGISPPRGTVGCHLSISCWLSPFRLAPRHDGDLREGFDVGFPCHSACVLLQFAFLRLGPPATMAVRGRIFYGGLPYHSAFLPLAPPATLAVRGRFLTVVCLIIVPALPSITLRRIFLAS